MITLTKEEFAQKYGSTKTISKEEFNNRYNDDSFLKKAGFIGKEIVKGVLRPVVKSFLAPGQAIVSAATGKTPTDLKVPFLGDVTPPQTVRGGVGTALQTGLLGVGGSALKGGKIASTIAKESAIGAGFGLGVGLEEEGRGKDLIAPTAIGAALGAVAPVAIKGIGKGFKGATGAVSKLVPVIRKTIGDKAYNKLLSVSRDLVKMSPTQTRSEVKWNKNTPKFIVDEGVVNTIGSDGKRIVTDDAVTALQEKYFAESRAFNKLLVDSGDYVSLNNFKAKALATIDDKFKARGSDYNKALKQIVDEVDAYKANYRGSGLVDGDDVLVNISDFNRIKTGLWSKTSNFNPSQADKLLSDVNYRMGQTAKTLIEDTVDDVAVKQMNSRLGDFASAIDVLQKANNKVLPGGFFGKAFTRLAGSIAGSGGGVPGTLIGNLSGGMLADVMMNPQYKTGALIKFLKLLQKENPKSQSIIDDAHAILVKRDADRAVRKLLKESDVITVPPKTDTSRVLSQKEAKKFLEGTGTIKGGEMFGVVAGIEFDEDGNMTFNPEAALAGMVAIGVVTKSGQIKALQESFDSLSKRISKVTNKTIIKQLENAKKEISDLMWKIRNDEGGFTRLPGKNAKGVTPSTISDDIAKAKASGKSFDEFVKTQEKKVTYLRKENFDEFTNTKEFKDWFGKSKMIDNGKPELYYHRTDANFDSFKKIKDKDFYRDTGDEGIYFSNKPFDDFYGKNEYAVTLKIDNPLKTREDFSSFGERKMNELVEQGYDGIITADETIVFKPEQVKIFAKNQKTIPVKSQLKQLWNKQ